MSELSITTFYKFIPTDEAKLAALRDRVESELASRSFLGLVLLGTEGVNGTVLGPTDEILSIKNYLASEFGELNFKDSPGIERAFLRLRVRIKEEIVTLNRPDLVPLGPDHHLNARDWHVKMQDPNVKILDVRNDYEVDIGKFRGAADFRIDEFHDFPDRLKNSDIKKDDEVLIYCTGGIRCEKAILEMREQGYEKVYQLDGGILKYLEEYGKDGLYDGECFVFDHRVAVNANLQPTEKYKLCPHCGQPGETRIDCAQCGLNEIVCEKCLSLAPEYKTCSKNCAHHFRMGHQTKRIHWDGVRKRMG